MDNKKLLMSLATAIAASKAARTISSISLEDVLGTVGLARRRNHTLENLGLITLGAVIGAGAAILLAPASGQVTRQRLSEEASKLGGAAVEALRERKDEAVKAISQVTNGNVAQRV